MSDQSVLIYLMRRDLRVADNPIFHALSNGSKHKYTHLLPVYIFPAHQVEISGFLAQGKQSPYPVARSSVGRFWRCGPMRAQFLAESVWDLKDHLESVGSGLSLRVGMFGDTIQQLIEELGKQGKVGAVWMTGEDGVEEQRDERAVKQVCKTAGVDFKLWVDEKYYIDDRDLPFCHPSELPDVFTTYRKTVEPLRDAPREVLPTPSKGSLPPLPSKVPSQQSPFLIPDTYHALESALVDPVRDMGVKNPPKYPEGTQSAHPFHGGSKNGNERIVHLIKSGSMTSYKATRNGLLGLDYSTKLSAWLSFGCITARQVQQYLLEFEDGSTSLGRNANGYGKGENEGTKAVRFELLWRDYMRLCTRKFGPKLFRLSGFREDESHSWKTPKSPTIVNGNQPLTGEVDLNTQIERILNGTSGMGLIDASQRELYLTGYTSNRARQNVASFMAKHLNIDWRIGAEWYECCLIDYDLSSNWGNWQYVAGVGNDPRGEARVFNPVKQAYDYDPNGDYVRAWVPELRNVEDLQEIFQVWRMPQARREELGLSSLSWADMPLKRIDFTVGKRAKSSWNNTYGGSSRGRGKGEFRGGSAAMDGEKGRGKWGKRGGRGANSDRGSGREFRSGMMEKHMKDEA